MDIIVTTPKTQRELAAKEAEDCKREGGGCYFRKLGKLPKHLEIGERCFYVEDDVITGFCIIREIRYEDGMTCDTSGRQFDAGVYVFMDADTWKWIYPIPMLGFQGWRYSRLKPEQIQVLGDWLEPRPYPLFVESH